MKKEGSSFFEGQITQKPSQIQMNSGSKLEEISDVIVYCYEMLLQLKISLIGLLPCDSIAVTLSDSSI